jgi:hypothetical protein
VKAVTASFAWTEWKPSRAEVGQPTAMLSPISKSYDLPGRVLVPTAGRVN